MLNWWRCHLQLISYLRIRIIDVTLLISLTHNHFSPTLLHPIPALSCYMVVIMLCVGWLPHLCWQYTFVTKVWVYNFLDTNWLCQFSHSNFFSIMLFILPYEQKIARISFKHSNICGGKFIKGVHWLNECNCGSLSVKWLVFDLDRIIQLMQWILVYRIQKRQNKQSHVLIVFFYYFDISINN